MALIVKFKNIGFVYFLTVLVLEAGVLHGVSMFLSAYISEVLPAHFPQIPHFLFMTTQRSKFYFSHIV
jgi:hypothetical protein